MFQETDNPVCLALFSDRISDDFLIYENDCFIGEHNAFKKEIIRPVSTKSHSFLRFLLEI